MRYETAYFCGYAKLPMALPATVTNGGLTIGLKIELETGIIQDASCTLLSNLAQEMVKSYVVGRNIVDDIRSITQEIFYRHQGIAAKPIIKAIEDIRKNYLEYMEKNRDFLQRC